MSPTPVPTGVTARPALPWWRKAVLGLGLASAGLLLVVLVVEGGLRLAGVGVDPRAYRVVETPEGRWIRENRSVTAPYFTQRLLRRPFPFRLPAEKAPGTYRVFVLGSSAAMGDPEPSFSFARQLEAQLAAAYPEVGFEVVNAAITAINSHVVRRIACDLAELEPDLFVVYEGNNEVIGPFGPATVFTPFLGSPTLIRIVDTLRRTRTGQLINELTADRRGDAGEWGGLQMFLHQQIVWDDPRLDLTRRLLGDNVQAIARAADDAGARTFVCTVLTNQRDFAPFLSGHRSNLTEEERTRWETAVADGHARLAAGDVAAAETNYRAALAIDDESADLTFRLARIVLGQRRLQEAQQLFQRALDLDRLRFRTDSKMNALLGALAAPDVEVVDLASMAAAESAGGVIGEEFLLEHVHLNFAGNSLVARELFARISEDLRRRGLIAAARPLPLTAEVLRLRLGYTAYEQAMILRELLDRYSRPPFSGQADHAGRVRVTRARLATVEKWLAQPGASEALVTLYAQARAAAPNDWVLARNAGMALVALGRPAEALPHLEAARATIDDDPPALFALAVALDQTGRTLEAKTLFAELRQLEPAYPGLPAE